MGGAYDKAAGRAWAYAKEYVHDACLNYDSAAHAIRPLPPIEDDHLAVLREPIAAGVDDSDDLSMPGWPMGAKSPISRLPIDSADRKDVPLYSGPLRYFPDALAEVARLCKAGNDKHNPGEPLHWSRSKSDDHLDCLARHLLEAGTVDDDGFLHDVKIAWRSLARLQTLLEKERGLPISPGSKP